MSLPSYRPGNAPNSSRMRPARGGDPLTSQHGSGAGGDAGRYTRLAAMRRERSTAFRPLVVFGGRVWRRRSGPELLRPVDTEDRMSAWMVAAGRQWTGSASE